MIGVAVSSFKEDIQKVGQWVCPEIYLNYELCYHGNEPARY